MASNSGTSSPGFVAEYTAKDLILYALAIGFGSSDENWREELRFLYEHHPNFSAVPTFPLVLLFWANRPLGTSHGVQSFPPPMMKAIGVLPEKFLRSEVPKDLPVIHASFSFFWHRAVPVPCIRNVGESPVDEPITMNLDAHVVSVAPKSIGTFVTTETLLRSAGSLSCTLQSTTLVLGMPPEQVIPFDASDGSFAKPRRHSTTLNERKPVFAWTYATRPTQEHWYRMASGDTNAIHIDSSSIPFIGSDVPKRPLLHGLCTLGIAVRAIMCFMKHEGREFQFRELHVQFTRPVLVGDSLCVQIWEDAVQRLPAAKRMLLFKVANGLTRDTVIDHGIAVVEQTSGPSAGPLARM